MARRRSKIQHQNFENRIFLDASPRDPKIADLVRRNECSARLKNCIEREAKHSLLPLETVSQYIAAGNIASKRFTNQIYGFGVTLSRELDALVREAHKSMNKPEYEASQTINLTHYDSQDVYPYGKKKLPLTDTTNQHPERDLHLGTNPEDPSIPELIHLNDCSARLKNCVKQAIANKALPYKRVSDYIYDKANAIAVIKKNLKNAGEKSANELHALMIQAASQIENPSTLRSKEREIEDSITSAHTLEEILSLSLSMISPDQRDVVERRYGINGPAQTLQEIADQKRVSRERIRQIEKKAKKEMATQGTVKVFSSCLEREDVLSKLFLGRKLVAKEHISAVRDAIRPKDRLAIDIAYGDLKTFLDSESICTEVGWVKEHDILSVMQERSLLEGSLRQRLIDVIRAGRLPIRVSRLAKSVPDYPISSIEKELVESLEAELDGDIVRAARRLPGTVRCTLVLREAGHALHCSEIRARIYEAFGKDNSIGQIGNTLSGMREALIVARGSYDLYENLSLTDVDLRQIRDRAYRYLDKVGGFVSTKVIFSELFQGETEHFGVEFDYYMLLGILQDDTRFDAKRGMMIGLSSGSVDQEFSSLREEVVSILIDACCPMSLADIANELQGRRDVFPTSISTSLDHSPEAVSVGPGRYDLVRRVIGDELAQEKLITASTIALAGGAKSIFALSELIMPICGELRVRTLKSFFQSRLIFNVNNDTVSLVEMPKEVEAYIQERSDAARHDETRSIDKVTFSERLARKGIPDLSHLDPLLTLKSRKENASEKDEMLAKILEEFGIN